MAQPELVIADKIEAIEGLGCYTTHPVTWRILVKDGSIVPIQYPGEVPEDAPTGCVLRGGEVPDFSACYGCSHAVLELSGVLETDSMSE